MTVFGVRLLLDLIAAGLVIACLAYWWLDNLSHELMGTALFVLVIVHNVFNRRWYGGLRRGRWDAPRMINLATIIGLGLAMLVLLVTSVLISRDLFAFLALDGAFAVREIHMFAAYWLVLILAGHLGTRWAVVMNACRSLFGIGGPNPARTLALRCAALAVVLWGANSSFEMTFGSKLMLTYTLDMWDFNERTLLFFANYASIVGMYAAIIHYALAVFRKVAAARATGGLRR